jgi:hypothetical protein
MHDIDSPDIPGDAARRPNTQPDRRADPRAGSVLRAAPDLDDTAVEAEGRISEAWETVERARGHLYAFHQLTGEADLALDEAVRLLSQAGHTDLAERVRSELIGRNVIEGRWTYQLIEEYEAGYYAAFRAFEQEARQTLTGGLRHVYEARMKEARRSPGRRDQAAGPTDGPLSEDVPPV